MANMFGRADVGKTISKEDAENHGIEIVDVSIGVDNEEMEDLMSDIFCLKKDIAQNNN